MFWPRSIGLYKLGVTHDIPIINELIGEFRICLEIHLIIELTPSIYPGRVTCGEGHPNIDQGHSKHVILEISVILQDICLSKIIELTPSIYPGRATSVEGGDILILTNFIQNPLYLVQTTFFVFICI